LDNGIRFAGDATTDDTTGDSPQPTFYADPDGVVRGAMGNYVTPLGTTPASTTVGLPLATAYPNTYNYSTAEASANQGESRPYFLHRPFRSVAELGYVFSGTPWKNIDFFTPQSGDVALLDVFSPYEPPAEATNPEPLVAGVVDLNTRQIPVLQALLSGAYQDEVLASGSYNTPFTPISSQAAATLLTTTSGTSPNFLMRTASTSKGQGPLQNISDLVGRWTPGITTGTNNYAPGFNGPSGDLSSLYAAALPGNLSPAEVTTVQNVDRFREAFIRPLAAVGNTRVWNLMIDVVAQTGRYPVGTTNPQNFVVEGEQRYWVHVAIDRFTGQVLDKQVEVVKE
jgi:hypothetical protein